MNRLSVLKKSIKTAAFLVVPVLFLAVKCDRPETVGPEFAIAPEGFAVNSFTVGGSTVDFTTTPKDTFYANFNSNVSWTLTLTGLTSGASKVITGTSQAIDGSDLSWLWDGGHDGLYFFRKNEQVEAKVTFLGSNVVVKDTIQQIISTKTFKDFVVMDFETAPAWTSYSDAPKDNPSGLRVLVEGGALDNFGGSGRTLPKAVQGTNAFYWYSKDAGDYFGGGAAKDVSLAQRALFPSADSLYLNVYIYGMGDPNSKLNFGAREDDDGNGSHNPANEDEFQVQISIDHTGWKLFSFKYSDLAPSTSPTNGGSGNKIKQTNKITNITFGLISAPPKNFVEAIIDFPIITYGAPFNPANN